MLLWQDNEVDTSGEQGPADRISTGIGSGDAKNIIPQLMDPTMPIARQGIQFYTDLSNVANQIDSSIVLVDNAMQSIINTMGQGENLAAGIKKNFAEASLEIIKMGGSEKEALAIQSETLEVLGRNSTLSKEQYETLFATSKVTGQSVKELATSLLDVGGNIDQIATDMEAVVSRANSLGVNAKAVTEKVVENMDQMNRFGFQGGIDGLARMAAKAQVLRFDMGEVFELAEDLLSPEKAIELASSLQRLGATTTSLIDPLRLMDLAQNDVGELQNQLGELFKTYTFFDEETKKFQIMPSARRDLRQLSQELGIPLKEIEKMALGAADLDRKMSEIDFSGLDVEEDTRELVANLATMNKEGKYTIKNEAGVDEDLNEFIQRYADDEEGLKNFLQQQEEDAGKTAEEKMLERADAQLSHLKKIEASNEATAKALSLGIGGSEYATQLLDAQVAINKKLNETVTQGYQDPQFLKDLQAAGNNMKNASELLSQGNLKDGMADALSSMKEFGKSVLTQTGEIVKGYFKDIGKLGIKLDASLGTDFSQGLLDALKYFENPGTLKVTMYGDKTDNTKKIENAVAEPKEIESENTENQNKLFDVSLSQLEQTINLVSLMETMVGLSQNSNITNESSLRESVKYYSEKTESKVEGAPTTNQTFNESNNLSVLNQNFEEYLQTQKVDAENLKETFREMAEKQIQVIRENYTQTETGTFISKETGEEKTILQLIQPVKDFTTEFFQKFLDTQQGISKDMENTKEIISTKPAGELVEDTKILNIKTQLEEFTLSLEPVIDKFKNENVNINEITSSISNIMSNEKENKGELKPNEVVKNIKIVKNEEKSIINYLNDKVQPLEIQTLPEITKILTQSNDTVAEKLNILENSNKETLLNSNELNKVTNTQIQSQNENNKSLIESNELNKTISEQIQSQNKNNEVFKTTVNNLVENDKQNIKVIEKQTNSITGELVDRPQVPEIVQPQIPKFKPIENINVEKYLEKVERTTIEKTGKVEQTVKFDSPLPIKIEVTGIPTNNPAATEAFLTAIGRDRRFGLALEKAISGRNFNLVEKLD